MVNEFLMVFLIIEIVVFSYIDKILYNSFFTPFNVLAYPITVILLIATFLNPYFHFRQISIEVYSLFIFGFPVFWVGGQIPILIVSRMKKTISGFTESKYNVSDENLKSSIMILSWIIIAVLFYSFLKAYQAVGGVTNMGSDLFAYLYAGSGITGHLLALAIICIIYLVTILKKKDYLIIITIAVLSVCIILYQVKSWIYMTLVCCILSYIHKNNKIRLKAKHIFLLAFTIFSLFEASYFFSIHINTKNFLDVNIFFIRHFVGYLVAGVNGLSEHFAYSLPVGIDPDVLFMPFINLTNVIRGIDPMPVVSSYFVPIDLKGELTSNVKTIFGTIFIFGGYFIGIIYVLFLGFISYLVMIITYISRNIWYELIYFFLMSGLFLGWFDLYFNILTLIEIPFIMFLFSLISRVKFLPETIRQPK